MAAANPLQRIARSVLLPLSALSDRLGNAFYAGLAVLVIAWASFAIATGATSGMKNKAYDLIMKSRFHNPAADPDIVILDIDEAALAAMAPDYGRWPWPRNIMGEIVEGISAQKPKAIVFDITFSDPDVFNAESDKYFRDAIARTPNTYFPMIRLVKDNDKLSKLKVSQLPGVTRAEASADPNATYAVVLPYLYDVLDDHRLGTNNLYADDDGIVRNYHVYRDEYGWAVNSLPANVARAAGTTLPDDADILMNWRGLPPSYQRVSFHEVYFDLLKQQKTRPAHEFTGKIVIIGSTAPSLFDLKPTPVARIHPGVEILATALDNMKNQDYLSELPVWVVILTTMAAISLLAFAFVYNIEQRTVNYIFTASQTGFLAISYLFLNFSTIFVDLTAPFSFCLLYFTIARFYSTFQGQYRNGHPFFSTLLDEGNECRAIFIQCHNHLKPRNANIRMLGTLKRQGGLSRYGIVVPSMFRAAPLMHAFFRDTMLLYWLLPKDREAEVLKDVIATLDRMIPAIDKTCRRFGPLPAPAVTFSLHTITFKIDAQERWRLLGEEALAQILAMVATVTSAAHSGMIKIQASSEFKELCQRSTAITLSPALVQAGLSV